MKLLVTGSAGLVGSESVRYFESRGHEVFGIDNNMRRTFFGAGGDTSWQTERLLADTSRFTHLEIDIRDRNTVDRLFKEERFDAIFHCAAQPSHDLARELPLVDFDINAVGTINLLEASRRWSPEAPFVHMSTNKVYGDAPNEIELEEQETRWEFADPAFQQGIPETLRIDRSKHSIFGASKIAADVMVQEYGRYFGMPTCCLRGGCLTGPNHSAVELHGFLSYLVRCNLEGNHYTVFGYKAKQVRDNLHAHDVVRFADEFVRSPRFGEVYNLGGGRHNSISILEAFSRVETVTGKKMDWSYSDQHREGDHICYYSDLRKMKSHYKEWSVSINLDSIVEQVVGSWRQRLST